VRRTLEDLAGHSRRVFQEDLVRLQDGFNGGDTGSRVSINCSN
jgi:hypothetical protein